MKAGQCVPPGPARSAAMKCQVDTEVPLRDTQHLSVLLGWVEKARWQMSMLIDYCDHYPKDQHLAHFRQSGMVADHWDEVESKALVHVIFMVENGIRDVTSAIDTVVDQQRELEESEAPK